MLFAHVFGVAEITLVTGCCHSKIVYTFSHDVHPIHPPSSIILATSLHKPGLAQWADLTQGVCA